MSEVLDLLGRGDLRVLGRIIGSSNSALLVEVSLDGQTALAIHKPIAFERPLWDYPNGDLAHREHAAYLISEAGGFEVVPPTVVREGPWGLGSTQQWVGDPDQPVDPVVVVCAAAEVPQEWLRVIEGQDEDGGFQHGSISCGQDRPEGLSPARLAAQERFITPPHADTLMHMHQNPGEGLSPRRRAA